MLTGSYDRQHAYVALTRSTHQNAAFVFTTPVKLADPAPGTWPAAELARYDRLIAQAASPYPVIRDALEMASSVSVPAEIIGRRGAASRFCAASPLSRSRERW
jgi:hypothetical protein